MGDQPASNSKYDLQSQSTLPFTPCSHQHQLIDSQLEPFFPWLSLGHFKLSLGTGTCHTGPRSRRRCHGRVYKSIFLSSPLSPLSKRWGAKIRWLVTCLASSCICHVISHVTGQVLWWSRDEHVTYIYRRSTCVLWLVSINSCLDKHMSGAYSTALL